MEYLFITLFQFLGIAIHVGYIIYNLDKSAPEKTAKQIFALFIENEWSSLLISAVLYIGDVSFHLLLYTYFPQSHNIMVTVPLIGIEVPFVVLTILLSLVIGFGGQGIAYAWLNKGKSYLINKAG